MKRLLLLLLCLAPAAHPDALPTYLSWEHATELALRHNPELTGEGMQVLIATQQVELVRASRRPQVRLLAGAAYEDDPAGFGTGAADKERWNVDLRLDTPLLSSGRFNAQADQAEASLRASGFDLQAATLRVRTETQLAYLAAQLAQRVVGVQQASLDLLQAQAAESERRYQAGALSKLPYLQARVAFENAKPELLRAQTNHELAVDRLRTLIGLPYPEGRGPADIRLEESWQELPPTPAALEDALHLALVHRPELAAIDARLAALEAETRFQARSLYPDLDGYVSAGAQNDSFDEDSDVRSGWQAGLVFAWPLFDGGVVKSRVAQAEARSGALLAERSRFLADVENRLRQAWTARELALAIRDTVDLRIATAEETHQLARISHEQGRATQLDVLQADLALTRARLDRIEAEHDRLSAELRLWYAIGTAPASTAPEK